MDGLRVELYHDDEADNWHFRVPALSILGGGAPTREHATHDAVDAITFALEGDRDDDDLTAEVVYVPIGHPAT